MDTLRTQIPNENQAKKDLFKQLFQFQILLKSSNDSNVENSSETKRIIESIDQLMELLLKSYEIEE